ncbi:MAG TPA: hypothetical protein PLW01_02545 [Agitococcus sp.]|nr:hypothetical protein [Agitococcus sp.]
MTGFKADVYHRRSLRLKGYDYSQAGLYFITVCCQDRACLLGDVILGEMVLNDAGNMIHKQWLKLSQRFNHIQLHEYVVMPNHFHAIIEIIPVDTLCINSSICTNQNNTDIQYQHNVGIPLVGIQNNAIQKGQPQGLPLRKTIGDILDAFKSITTVEYIRGVNTKNWPSFNRRLWQRNYYEHIIRHEQSYQNLSEYICNNPTTWTDDKFYQT